jgi:hypothetical protein
MVKIGDDAVPSITWKPNGAEVPKPAPLTTLRFQAPTLSKTAVILTLEESKNSVLSDGTVTTSDPCSRTTKESLSNSEPFNVTACSASDATKAEGLIEAITGRGEFSINRYLAHIQAY